MGLDDEDCVKSNSEFSGQWEENSGESEGEATVLAMATIYEKALK